MRMRPLKADIVRAAVHGCVPLVLDALDIEHRVAGSQLATRRCPACGERSRFSVHFDVERDVYFCQRCRKGGDMLSAIAGYLGLDIVRDFRAVLDATAKLINFDASAHPTPTPTPMPPSSRANDRDHAAAVTDAAWARLDHRSVTGECWLRDRGIDPTPLIAADVIRFDFRGGIAVRINNLVDGRPCNIATRWFSPRGPNQKVTVRATRDGFLGTRGTLVGAVTAISATRNVVLVTEGVTDTLAAVLLWPDAIVVGANGAGMLAHVVRAVAPRVRAVAGTLVGVPDLDAPGAAAMGDALRCAVADHGFVLDRDLRVVDVAPHKDLSDAVRAGFLPGVFA